MPPPIGHQRVRLCCGHFPSGWCRLSDSAPGAPSALLRSLQAFGATHSTERKLLVGPTLLWGRELLRALARTTGGWIGWEPTTIRALADDLALVALSDA